MKPDANWPFAVLMVVAAAFIVATADPDRHTHEPVGAARSPCWQAVRAAYLKGHPVCESCGGKTNIEGHHVRPFHIAPELECDVTNIIALCRDCHFKFGHRCDDGKSNWSCENPNVRSDAARNLMAMYGPKD